MSFYGFYKILFHLIFHLTIRIYLTKKNINNYITQENLTNQSFFIYAF